MSHYGRIWLVRIEWNGNAKLDILLFGLTFRRERKRINYTARRKTHSTVPNEMPCNAIFSLFICDLFLFQNYES